MTGILNKRSLEMSSHDSVGDLPFYQNWFLIKTTQGKLLAKIYKSHYYMNSFVRKKGVKLVYGTIIKAHTAREAVANYKKSSHSL